MNKKGRVKKKKKKKEKKDWVEKGKFLKEKLIENHGGDSSHSRVIWNQQYLFPILLLLL